MTQLRRYQFKLYPNSAQADALEEQRRLHCGLYNALLEMNERVYQRERRHVSYFENCKNITLLVSECPEYRALSRSSLDATAQKLERAYQAFFRRLKDPKVEPDEKGPPTFKKARHYPGFSMKKRGSGWDFVSNGGYPAGASARITLNTARHCDDPGTEAFQVEGEGRVSRRARNDAVQTDCADRQKNVWRVRLKGCPGLIRARGKFPAKPIQIKTCEFLWRQERWWISVVVEMAPRIQAGTERRHIRLDLISTFAREEREDGGYPAGPKGRTSPQRKGVTGLASETPPKCGGVEGEGRVENLQRQQARCKKGSYRWRQLKRRIARRAAKTANQRKHRIHNLTTELVASSAMLTVTGPKSIKGVTASGKGDAREWGAVVKTKALANRRILDFAPGEFLMQIEYKAAEAGCKYDFRADDDAPAAAPQKLVVTAKLARKERRNVKQKRPA